MLMMELGLSSLAVQGPAPLPATHPRLTGGNAAAHPSQYLPSYEWVRPPGIGDPLQYVYCTQALAPLSIDGTGTRPAVDLASVSPALWQQQSFTAQGNPIDGGGFQLTGLYAPTPTFSPSNQVFPRGI